MKILPLAVRAGAVALLAVSAVLACRPPAAGASPRAGDLVGFEDRTDPAEVWLVLGDGGDGLLAVCRSEVACRGALCYADPEELFVVRRR